MFGLYASIYGIYKVSECTKQHIHLQVGLHYRGVLGAIASNSLGDNV